MNFGRDGGLESARFQKEVVAVWRKCRMNEEGHVELIYDSVSPYLMREEN